MLGKNDIGSRDKGTEERITSAAEQSAKASMVYAANRSVSDEAGLRSVVSASEKSMAGGKSGDSTNTFGDNVKDAAAEGKTGMDGYEAGIVAKQGKESLEHNPTMEHDAFQQEEQRFATQHDVSGREAGRSAPAQGMGGPTPADAAAMGTDGLTLATKDSAQNLTFGKDTQKPEGKEAGGTSSFAEIMEKSGLRESFASIAASGAKMGGNSPSLFGGGAPATPGFDKTATQKSPVPTPA